MRKFFAAAAIAAMAVAQAQAPAQADVIDYAQLFGGLTVEPDLSFGSSDYEMDNGFNVGGQFGWNVGNSFTVGLDFFFTASDYVGYDTSLESFSTMVAGTYMFDMGGARPYITAGLGGVQVNYEGDADWQFGYQAGAGVLIPVEDKIDLILGYRYQSANDATIGGTSNIEYQSHNLSIGFNFAI
jgi:opacity protein-like surface antigen